MTATAVGGVVVLTRPAAEVAPTAAVSPASTPTPTASASEQVVEDKLRQALATGSGQAPAVTAEPPAEETTVVAAAAPDLHQTPAGFTLPWPYALVHLNARARHRPLAALVSHLYAKATGQPALAHAVTPG